MEINTHWIHITAQEPQPTSQPASQPPLWQQTDKLTGQCPLLWLIYSQLELHLFPILSECTWWWECKYHRTMQFCTTECCSSTCYSPGMAFDCAFRKLSFSPTGSHATIPIYFSHFRIGMINRFPSNRLWPNTDNLQSINSLLIPSPPPPLPFIGSQTYHIIMFISYWALLFRPELCISVCFR